MLSIRFLIFSIMLWLYFVLIVLWECFNCRLHLILSSNGDFDQRRYIGCILRLQFVHIFHLNWKQTLVQSFAFEYNQHIDSRFFVAWIRIIGNHNELCCGLYSILFGKQLNSSSENVLNLNFDFDSKKCVIFLTSRDIPYDWLSQISQPIELETWLTLWDALTPTRIFMSPTEIDSKRTNLSFSLFEMRFCNIACPKVTWLNSRLWIDKQTKKISKNWLVTIVKKMESQKAFPRSSIDISVSLS